MNKFAGALLIGGAAIVAWNMFAPIEYTIPARMGQLLGAFEDEWTRTRTPAVAEQAQAIREAEAEVQRRTMAAQKAIEAERQVIERQITSTNSTHWIKSFAANGSDLLCGMALFSHAQGNAQAKESLRFCEFGDQIRRGMADDYTEVLGGGRTSVMRDMTQAFDDAQRLDEP